MCECSSYISDDSLAAIITVRFVTHPIGKYSPRLQVLIYPKISDDISNIDYR